MAGWADMERYHPRLFCAVRLIRGHMAGRSRRFVLYIPGPLPNYARQQAHARVTPKRHGDRRGCSRGASVTSDGAAPRLPRCLQRVQRTMATCLQQCFAVIHCFFIHLCMYVQIINAWPPMQMQDDRWPQRWPCSVGRPSPPRTSRQRCPRRAGRASPAAGGRGP